MGTRRRTIAWGAALAVLLAFTACEETPTLPEASQDKAAEVEMELPHSSSSGLVNSDAPFPVLHQGFEHDTEPWVDQSVPGALGWCGTIERANHSEGAVTPSAGTGYATVRDGACNTFWTNFFGGGFTSAPASLHPDALSTTWPPSGFVQQLDVHLDPQGADDGLVFLYANSLCVLADDGTCATSDTDASVFDFRYFAIPVTAAEGALSVAGHEVTEAGWYTFRHVFDSEADGTLTVDFELRKDGRTLARQPIESTLFPPNEATSDLDVEDLGSGYIWFVAIADGLELPIDEHQLRQGR